MAGNTSVNVEGMIAAQGNFQTALDSVNTAYGNMEEQQGNLQANWTGETASAFGQALGQWLTDCNTVKTQLSTILDVLSQNTGVYANTNEGSTQMAQSFANGMSGVPGLGI
jgi:WXG100 family type VII secretion target